MSKTRNMQSTLAADDPLTPTGIALNAINREIAGRCAEIAERIGSDLGEPAVGYAIAEEIRKHFK